MAGLSSFIDFTKSYAPNLLMIFLAGAAWFRGDLYLATGCVLTAVVAAAACRSQRNQVVRLERQKLNLDQQLIQSQKLASIGELSSGIAHEINNPLAVIGREVEWIESILADVSLEDKKQWDDLTDSLREIAKQVDRCQQITHKLLDFARKKEPLLQEVDVNRLVEDMTLLVEKTTSNKAIKIKRSYADDLPLLTTDPPLLRQVILNLVTNATHAIEKDGSICLTTRASTNDTIEIEVSDTGCGIPKENMSRIFDPFFTTKELGKGTGLGLSLCHGIITKLGGELTVESKVDVGSTFTIRFPKRRASAKLPGHS